MSGPQCVARRETEKQKEQRRSQRSAYDQHTNCTSKDEAQRRIHLSFRSTLILWRLAAQAPFLNVQFQRLRILSCLIRLALVVLIFIGRFVSSLSLLCLPLPPPRL